MRYTIPAVTNSQETNVLWDTTRQSSLLVPLDIRASDRLRTIVLSLHCRKRTGFRFHLDLLAPDAANCYRVDITVEWQGDNELLLPSCSVPEDQSYNEFYLPISAIKAQGSPAGWAGIGAILLHADEPGRDDLITLRRVLFSESHLPRPITPYEDAIETFFVQSFCHPSEWVVRSSLPQGQFDLEQIWFWQQVVARRPDVGDWVTIERGYPGGIDLAPYDRLAALVSWEKTATCDIECSLDGTWVTLVQGRHGINDYAELVAGLGDARRLGALRIRMASLAKGAPSLVGVISWILLRKRGVSDEEVRAHGAHGDPGLSARATPGAVEEESLPVGLFMSRDELPALRRRVREGLAKAMWDKLKARADGALEYDPGPHIGAYLPIRGGSSLSRRFSVQAPAWDETMMDLATAYLVTEEIRYAAQAKRIVITACRCGSWDIALQSSYPRGIWGYRAPFYPTHMAEAMAYAVDCIAPTLSDAERELIDQNLIHKAIFNIEEYLDRATYCRTMNQGVVFAVGGILAVLLVSSRHPEIEPKIKKLGDYLHSVLDAYFDEDGATDEGPGYWNYTIGRGIRGLLPLARHDRKPVSAKVTPKLARSLDYLLCMRSQIAEGKAYLNVSDAHYAPTGMPSDVLLFFANQLGRADALAIWREQFGTPETVPSDPLSVLFFDPDRDVPAAPELPLLRTFRGMQRVLWRGGWKVGDTLLMFSSGPWGTGHDHLDKHHLILEACGERMLLDRGIADYSDPICPQMKTTWSHNTVTVDGRDQVFSNRAKAARLATIVERDDYGYLASEAAPAYANLAGFRRELLFVRPEYFVLADTVSGAPGLVEWHWHSALPPEASDGGLVFRGQKGSLRMHIATPEAWQWQVEEIRTDVEGVTDHHVSMRFAEAQREYRFIALLIPLAAGAEQSVRIAPRAQGTDELCTIERAGTTDVLLRPRSGEERLIRLRRHGRRESGPA